MFLFLIVFSVFSIVFFLMTLGVILGRKPISGSCGGMGLKGLDCFFCAKKNSCKKRN